MGSFSHIAPYGYLLIEKQNLHIGNNVAIGPYCSIFCSTNTIPEDDNLQNILKEMYNTDIKYSHYGRNNKFLVITVLLSYKLHIKG